MKRLTQKTINGALVATLSAVLSTSYAAETTPVPDAGQTAEARLATIGAGADVATSAAYVQADAAYVQARSYFEKVHFHEAKLEIDRALRLFPEHAQARTLRDDINAVFGHRGNTLAVLTTWVNTLNNVALQEQALRMVRMLNEGDAFYEAQDFQRAFNRYDRVAISIRTFTQRFDWGELPLEVERKLRMAGAKIREEDLSRTEASRQQALAKQRRKTDLEENALREKVNQVLIGAADAYNRYDFRRAMVLAWDAYEMDRRREDARAFYLRARRAGHVKFNDYIREERDERIARVNEEMHQSLIPQTELLLYPEDWFKKTLRKPANIGENKNEPWVDDIKARLEEVVTIRFEETSLEDAVAFLRGQTGVNFVVAPEILVDEPAPITLTATNMKLKTALKWILEVTDLNMAIQNEAIYISGEAITGGLVFSSYDISDLISPVKDFPGLELAYNAAGTEGGSIFVVDDFGDADEGGDPEEIADFIRSSVNPASWDDLEGVDIAIHSGSTLFVSHTVETHALINELLNNLRNQQSLQVHLQVRMLDVEKGFFEEIGVSWTTLNSNTGSDFAGNTQNNDLPPRRTDRGFDNTSVGMTFNSSLNYLQNFTDLPQINATLLAAESENDSQVLEAPELTCFNGQRASASFVNQFAYIFDYNVETGSGGSGTLDPQITILNFGTLLDVRPVVSSDRKYVTLEVRPSSALLVRTDIADLVVLTTIAGFGISLFVPIELPVIEIRTMRSTVMIPDKGSLAVGGFTKALRQRTHTGIPFLAHIPFVGRLFGRNGVYDDNRRLFYLLTAEIIDLNERESLN